MKRCTIICVDDEKMILDNLEAQLSEKLGREFDIEVAESGQEALEIMEELTADGRHVAVIISDQMMPHMKGDAFLISAHELYPATPKILLTGQADLEAVTNAINHAKLYRYVNKPWEANDLMLTVEEAARAFLQHLQLNEYNRLLRSLNQASQEISGEMNLNVLVEKFIRTTIQNTGADRGYLVMNRDGQLMVETVASALEEESNRLKVELTRNRKDITRNILEKINITLTANEDKTQRMAAPINHKGKSIGYVIVENEKSREYFDKYQREVLEMLASQAAISLENASLYRNLELKNRDITDSIVYARRIQNAIMPQVELLQDAWPASFILYKPKDIVSGDFYWFAHKDDYLLVAAVDCTGHGVPGAFMSVMGSNFLNQIVNDYGVYEPDAILQYLHMKVKEALHKYEMGEGESKDGMDICLVSIHKPTQRVQYAGARRPLFLLRDGDMFELSPTKASIGETLADNQEPIFMAHTLQAKRQDALYLFSDGYLDQFGGSMGRKLGKARFKETLQGSATHTMDAQLYMLEQTFVQWQGMQEQTDDVLVIGIRF
jgi:serine phosphatase RsbU (regulator of sigma subunit)/FixJ family two-component response regulator